jgi:hypothetical protein
MAISREFLPLMLETVTLTASTTLDKYGKQSFAASGVPFRARIMWSERILRDKDGREIVEAGRAVLYGAAPTATPAWRITLPDGSTPKIVSVATIEDEDGDHHSVIGFGQG